ncbi:hypothetical protein AB0L34_13595 [Micromonospora sp. NPDC052213]|uniref:hypothetical protein n=1 Tax=Micromonospora sp. NPDC052213 TaxID=3155812 RepID=UPI00341325D3
MKRYVSLFGVIVATAGLAVVGTLAGAYLADRTATRQQDPTAAVTGSTGRPSTGSGNADPGHSASPGRSVSPGPSASPSQAQPAPRTYRLDRPIYEQASLSVTLVSAETSGGKLRLNISYRNDSRLAWPVSCPAVDVDLVSSHLTLSDGRTVRPERTWCATTRAGQSFNIGPGEQINSWAVYPVVPEAASSFELSWYDFPTLDVRLR